jgi:hypothetical protein
MNSFLSIILVSGRKNVGKDEFAKYIIKKCNDKNIRTFILRFAEILKDIVALLCGWDRKKLDGLSPEDRLWRESPDEFWTKKLGKVITPRGMLEYVGTEMIRNMIHVNFWVYNVQKRIDEIQKKHLNEKIVIIIPDCRFYNEFYETLREYRDKLFTIHIKSKRNPFNNTKRELIFGILQKVRDEHELYKNFEKINKAAEKIIESGPPEEKEHTSEWHNIYIEYIIKTPYNTETSGALLDISNISLQKDDNYRGYKIQNDYDNLNDLYAYLDNTINFAKIIQ